MRGKTDIEQIFTGIRVLDLTDNPAGAFCTMYLGDFGADVVKVERGEGDHGRTRAPLHNGFSAHFAALNRNKRSLLLEYDTPVGREVLLSMVQECDVLVDSAAPGVLEQMGLGYEVIRAVNPKLICASVTAYGHTGPQRVAPAHELLAEAKSGLLDRTGARGAPPMRPGVELGGSWASLNLLSGVSMALLRRQETGEGCCLEVAVLDSLFYLLELFVIEHSVRGCITEKNGNHDTEVAPLGTFRTKDGYVAIAVSSEGQWGKFCGLMGLEGLVDDPRFFDNEHRVANLEQLIPAIEYATATRGKSELERLLCENKLAAGAVTSVAELIDDPQARAAEMILDAVHPVLGHHHMVGTPIKMSATPAELLARPAPLLGEHTGEVLAQYGVSDQRAQALRVDGIVR